MDIRIDDNKQSIIASMLTVLINSEKDAGFRIREPTYWGDPQMVVSGAAPAKILARPKSAILMGASSSCDLRRMFSNCI